MSNDFTPPSTPDTPPTPPVNPYAASSVSMPSNTSAHGAEVSPMVIDQLARTRGWVRFISVLLWIGGVIMGLLTLSVLLGSSFIGISEAGGLFFAIALIYGVAAFIYIFLALRLGQYASRINTLTYTPTQEVLADALNAQRSFWKCTGICILVGIVLWIVAAVIAGVAAAATQKPVIQQMESGQMQFEQR